jgi:hypothetical protein
MKKHIAGTSKITLIGFFIITILSLRRATLKLPGGLDTTAVQDSPA